MGHVLYEMMMMAKCWVVGALLIAHHSTLLGPDRQTSRGVHPLVSRRAGDKAVHDVVYGRWTTDQFLGIDEKFGG